jgi:hypothetical protein
MLPARSAERYEIQGVEKKSRETYKLYGERLFFEDNEVDCAYMHF